MRNVSIDDTGHGRHYARFTMRSPSVHSPSSTADVEFGRALLRAAIAIAMLSIAAGEVAAQSAAAAGAHSSPDTSLNGIAQSRSHGPSATTRSAQPAFAFPGDLLRLRIWREPDMSGDYLIDLNGNATLPRLGVTRVTHIDTDSLQRMLLAQYGEYLRNPAVEISLLRRVRVVGAVRTPGLYNADETMHIRDVLALAGGPNPDGRLDRVRIDRDGTSTLVDLDDASSGIQALHSGDQLFVPQKSWLSRNTAIVASVLSVTGGLLIALAAR